MISTHDLLAALASEAALLVLDVRSRLEYSRGHIPGARHSPFWLVPARIGRLRARREIPIVVYCGHGPRAWFAAAALRRRGFPHVYTLRGHWAGWKRAGLPVHRPEKSRETV